MTYRTFTELSQKPEVYALVKTDITRINQSISPGVRVRKFINLYKEFDPEEGELTRTRKLRKTLLEARYREIIDAIYEDR